MTSVRYLTQCPMYWSEIGMKKISTTCIKRIKYWLQNVRMDWRRYAELVAGKPQREIADRLGSVCQNKTGVTLGWGDRAQRRRHGFAVAGDSGTELTLTEEAAESRSNNGIGRKTQTGLCCSHGLSSSGVLNVLHVLF